jgi:hypothetical protein
MKKELLAGTALIGGAAILGGAAIAAEAPTWKLTGNANFQFYWADQDRGDTTWTGTDTWAGTFSTTFSSGTGLVGWHTTKDSQDHDWYFGVDEAELQLNVSGTADNGLNYGFKIEINALTTDNTVADEVRLQLSGGWGTLQLGDEDGAEDIMNYGGENLMGATGGFDGDQDDYLIADVGDFRAWSWDITVPSSQWYNFSGNIAAPSYPTIAGDTSDQTKVSYFSPRFSGFQVGASLTPTPNNGDDFKADGAWENHIGLGANYDNSFGGVRVRASAVYSAASSNDTKVEDVSAWSVGGIVGFGPFSLGANYTDNGESGSPISSWGAPVSSGWESSYWDVAASFETGPLYFSAGYFSSLSEGMGFGESTYEHIALTADYTVAPGLAFYAEINMIDMELADALQADFGEPGNFNNSATSLVLGANVSF